MRFSSWRSKKHGRNFYCFVFNKIIKIITLSYKILLFFWQILLVLVEDIYAFFWWHNGKGFFFFLKVLNICFVSFNFLRDIVLISQKNIQWSNASFHRPFCVIFFISLLFGVLKNVWSLWSSNRVASFTYACIHSEFSNRLPWLMPRFANKHNYLKMHLTHCSKQVHCKWCNHEWSLKCCVLQILIML